MGLEEGDERSGDGIEQAAAGPERFAGLIRGHDLIGLGGLCGQKCRQQSNGHDAAVKKIRGVPADARGDGQNNGIAHQQSAAITEGVAGGQKPQLIGITRRFNPPGVDCGILRGGGEGHYQRGYA
jgi:hypothetical protein